MATEVRVSLTVDQKGTAAKGMQDLATATTQAANATKQLKTEQARGAGVGAGAGVGGTGGAAAGLPPGVAAAAGAAIALRGLEMGLGGLAKAFNAVNDVTLTSEQRTRALAEAIPLIGGIATAMFSFRDAVEGLPAILANLSRETAIFRAEAQARMQAETTQRAEQFGIASRQAAAAGAAGSAAIRLGLPAFGETLAARQRFREEESLLPGRRAAISASQQAAALSEQAVAGEGKIGKAEEALDAARKLRDTFIDAARAEQDTVTKAGLLKAAEEAGFKVVERKAEVQQRINQQQEIEKNQIQATAAAREATLNLDRQRLAILKEQEQRITSQLQAFGALRPGQQRLAARFAQQFQERGFESLTEFQRSTIAQAGGGQALSLAAEQAARNNPLAREFAQNLGLDTQDVGALREQIRGMAVNIDTTLAQNQKLLTEEMAKALGNIGKKILEMTEEAIRDAGQEAERAIIAARAAGRGP